MWQDTNTRHNTFNNTYDAMVIVDAYERAALAKAKNEEVDYGREAATLRVLARAMSRNPRTLAIVPDHEDGIERAYRDAGFTVRPMNGNRPTELPKLIGEEIDVLDMHNPKRVIFVGSDPTYSLLARQAVRNHAEVAFWWPEALPPELNRPEYDFRRLEDVVPGATIRVSLGVVYIDYENIHIGLERMGIHPNPTVVIEAVRAEASDIGKIVEIHAYADWQELSKGSKLDIQRELVKIGVKTHYQISRHGKNTADMDIVNDVRSRIERPLGASDAVDAVVLVTRDRDFATIAKQAQSQGKRVRILGLREGFSQDLAMSVGDVRYLDSHFAKTAPQGSGNRADDEQFTFIMRTVAFLQEKRYAWVYTNKLAAAVAPTVSEGMQQVRQAMKDGLLKAGPEDKPNTVCLDTSHPDSYAAWWLYGRIDFSLNKRRMPYVDTNFLKRGMEQDERLQAMGIGQTWSDTKRILELAAASGSIERASQPNPKNPAKQIDTWWIAGRKPASASASEPSTVSHEEATAPEAEETSGQVEAETPQAVPPKPQNIVSSAW